MFTLENLLTLIIILVALFGEKFREWLNRPEIVISFDKSSDRCYRWATLKKDFIQDETGEGGLTDAKRQYFRLRVKNNGGLAKKLKIKTDVLFEDGREVDRFEPSTLRWLNGEEVVDLARGEIDYVNFLSQLLSHKTDDRYHIKNSLRIELYNTNPRGIAWDRDLRDISTYKYKIIIHGENVNPKIFTAKFTRNKNVKEPGNLEIE